MTLLAEKLGFSQKLGQAAGDGERSPSRGAAVLPGVPQDSVQREGSGHVRKWVNERFPPRKRVSGTLIL